MERRNFLQMFGSGAAAMALSRCGASPPAEKAADARPNIIFLMADDRPGRRFDRHRSNRRGSVNFRRDSN
jgi:hypothetical protein